MAPLVETGMPLMAFSLTAVVTWVVAVGLVVATGGTLGRSTSPQPQPLPSAADSQDGGFERQREVFRRTRVARGFLWRVGPRERQVRGLVAHDPAELRDRGPVHEDPDPVRDVGGEATLEPVSKPESRRAVDGLDEGHECLRDRELDARLGERRQRRLDVGLGRERGADAVGSPGPRHVHAPGARGPRRDGSTGGRRPDRRRRQPRIADHWLAAIKSASADRDGRGRARRRARIRVPTSGRYRRRRTGSFPTWCWARFSPGWP